MKVEFLVSIKHPEDSEPMFLTQEQAKEVYDQLHARFGDFGQARELSQLARESVAREMRLAELEAEVSALRQFLETDKLPLWYKRLTHDISKEDVTYGEGNHIADVGKMVDDADSPHKAEDSPHSAPSNTPEPPTGGEVNP